MTDDIDPGVLEAILATADAEDDDERDDLWNGYFRSGYESLADAVEAAEDVIDEASRIVVRESFVTKLGAWMYRDGREL